MYTYLPDITLILPELFLILIALLILVEGVFKEKLSSYVPQRFSQIAFISLLIALILLIVLYTSGNRNISFEGQLIQDEFSYISQILILGGSAAVLGVSLPSLAKEQLLSFEYPALVLFATVGMLIMVAANDFISLFMGLEIQALSLYILVSLDHDQIKTAEAATKYFVLGALSTCFYLYGASLIYGFTGSTNFDVLTNFIQTLNSDSLPLGLIVGLLFIISSLGFKVSSVPFHMWTPDVYQGCPTPITTFIAATPKISAMLVLTRLLLFPFLELHQEWLFIVSILSCFSMLWGAFAVLNQSNLKRFLAYSSIGQMGYVLMGIAAGNEEGLRAVFLYLTLYLFMIVGTFGCLLCLRGKGSHSVQTIEDLAGLSALHPRTCFILTLFMFSLAGIPPLAGFFAKLYVFKAALSAELYILATTGGIATVVSAYYYLKVIKTLYFEEAPHLPTLSYGQTLLLSPKLTFILNICALVILFFFALPNPTLELIHRAVLPLSK